MLLLQGLGGCSADNKPGGGEATSAAPAVTQAAAQTGPLVVAFGDSLYAGYGLGPKDSFPAKLEQALRANGLPVTIRNAGVSGNTTAEALRRLTFTLEGFDRKPDLVMVNLGGNDMLRGIDPKETRANLAAICEELQRRGIPILLTGMIAAPNMGADYAGRFNPIYTDLARKYDAALYPFFLDGVVTQPRLMQADRVHPTAQGIDVIVGKVEPQVEKVLRAQMDR
jgi:acyl-CoA thioesterase-1